MATVHDCRMITLPRVLDPRGSLTFIESERNVPFDIRRVFYIYDVPAGESRGAHAHRTLQQFMICLAGSFEVSLNDGRQDRRVRLDSPFHGLLVPPMIWAAETHFAAGTVCLVLASDAYDETDYIRDFGEYLSLASEGSGAQ